MEFSRYLILLPAFLQVCLAAAHWPCPEVQACTCSRITSYQIDVDCRGTKLNVSNTCRICKTIQHVWRLDLSENNIKDIPASCFEDCSKLEEMTLASNKLSQLKKQAFSGLISLKHLYLDQNTLLSDGKFYDQNLFEPLTRLELLSIRGNVKVNATKQNTYLSNVGNNSLTHLRSLYLDGLPDTRFGSNFLSFTKLTSISFSGKPAYCNMGALTKFTFENVPYTEILNISHCNILRVDAETFESLKELRVLNISYNMALGFPSLRNVSFGLQNCRKMEVLDYSKVYKTFGLTTQINRCDMWFLQNTTLREIRLNSNRLSAFEVNALSLLPPTLEVGFLEDNKLTFGPFALQGGCVPNLTHIELNEQDSVHSIASYNDEIYIQENGDDTSGGCFVDRRNLSSSCRLSKHKPLEWWKFTIPISLRHLSARNSNFRYEKTDIPLSHLRFRNVLESADLSNNVIYSWTDPFLHFYSLKHLNLSYNFCFNISGQFFLNCPNITSLDASHNKIGPVLAKDTHGSTFRFLKSLNTLDMSSNLIGHLPENTFIYSESLGHLDLSFNQIESINFKYQHMRNLSVLLLRQNKITTLPVKLLNQMSDTSKANHKNITVDLSGNILDASDCENLEFLLWLKTNPEFFTDVNSYEFYTGTNGPISYSAFLNSFSQIQHNCNHKTYSGLITIASLFIVISISVITGAIIYRYRWRLRYLYYMTKARYNGYIPVRETEVNRKYQYDLFVSYATDDYQFVTGEMYNTLNEAGLTICLHQKDFVPGNAIAENIVQAVRNSKLTLIVLSPAFVESKWCMYEFNMARMESIYSREEENMLFIVMYENVDLTMVTPEMRDCLETESYLAFPQDEAEQAYFWQILTQRLCNANTGNS